MLVKDLMYLLQTRCKPDDSVTFTAFVSVKSGVFEIGGDSDDSFSDVWREETTWESEDGGAEVTDGHAKINVGKCLVENLMNHADEWIKGGKK